MASDAHLDGNVMGGLLMEVFGQEMTDALGCCAHCGDKNQVGALIVYRGGPGEVMFGGSAAPEEWDAPACHGSRGR